MTTLALEKITKFYGLQPCLTDISVEVGSGEFLVLLGPSGCGKSTLLHAIAGLHRITSGDIIVDGKIEAIEPTPDEVEDNDNLDAARIAFPFNRRDYGRLRQLIDLLNGY